MLNWSWGHPYDDGKIEDILSEISIYSQVDDKNLMGCNGIGRTWNDDICIIMPRMDTTLYEKIRENKTEHYDEWKIWFYFLQVCWGVSSLHSVGIWHLDIKADNILIKNEDWNAKLTDYTLSVCSIDNNGVKQEYHI